MARVRRDVWKLPADDDTLLWYGRAVGEMLKRTLRDPTGWRYMGAVHDYAREVDPYKKSGDRYPTVSEMRTYWLQCQHGTWFFLPWHRMYLYYFEQIVAATVVKLGGPSDWTLPYWNYSENFGPGSTYQLLPEAFRNPTLPDGTPNNLYVQARDPKANAGQPFVSGPLDVDIQTALAQTTFYSNDPNNFGGAPTGFQHSGGEFGRLERRPHNSMHVAIGGTGWMSDTRTAALDPIFWLHHANIDRLWQVWLNEGGVRQDPNVIAWSGQVFYFHDAKKLPVHMTCSQVVDTNALGYTYDDTTPPVAPLAFEHALAAGIPARRAAMPEPIPPELVGATESSFQVDNSPARISVPTPSHAAARTRIVESALAADVPREAAQQHRVYLRLENLTAPAVANSYDVYVNVPEGQDPTKHPELFADRLDLFGIASATAARSQHAGSGLTFTLDISNIYHTLASAPGWNPDHIDVTMVPVREWQGATVTVGRVSLFFA